MAVQKQQDFQREMLAINQKFTLDNKEPKYQTDREGNLLAIIDGKAQKVRDTEGNVVATTKTQDYADSVSYNSDLAQFVTTRTYEDWRLPDFFTSNINWDSSTNLAVFDSISNISGKVGKYSKQVGQYECGEAVNYYLKDVGITNIRMGDSYESKRDTINNNAPQVWGLAIWNPSVAGWKFAENGHVGIVTGYNSQKNTVEITDWNSKWDREKRTYEVPVSQIINSDGGFRHLNIESEQAVSVMSQVDISTFNSNTFKPESLKTPADKEKYATFLDEKSKIFSDKNASIDDILKFSSWGKELTDSTIGSLTKFDSVITQLWDIQAQISDMDTWPVKWKLAWLNPYNTDAQVLKAQLTALIPNLARGVYGEVWVLTDNDVKLYSKTIPNLESTSDVNKAVLAMTLKVVAWGYKRQLQNLAASGKDVSWFKGLYDNLSGQVSALETDIWLKTLWADTINTSWAWKSTIRGVLDLQSLVNMNLQNSKYNNSSLN
jgi:hypothetical protein